MNAVFLDTVGLIATWDESDQWHQQADRVFQNLLHQRRQLVTTPQILLECGNASARRPYRTQVSALRRILQSQNLLIVPTDDEIDHAWAAFDRGGAGDAGIVDQISFVVMRRAGLTEAFTNDRHYRIAGFVPLF